MKVGYQKLIYIYVFIAIAVLSVAGLGTKAFASAFSDTRVIVTQCTVEGGGLVAGSTSKVVLRLKNTSAEWPVMGVLVTGKWADASSPVEFELSNQAYAGIIAPNQEVEAHFSVKTKEINLASSDSIPFSLNISYSKDGVNENINTVTIQVPVFKESVEQSNVVDLTQLMTPEAAPVKSGWRGYIYLIYIVAATTCLFGGMLVLFMRIKKR